MTSTVTKPLIKRAQMDSKWLEVQPFIQESFQDIRKVLKKVSEFLPTCNVLSRCKKRESAAEKLVRKGYSSYFQIGDLVKGTILTDNLDESLTVVNYLITHFNVIKCESKKGSEENPYCGAIHVDISLGKLTCEIQVMPKATWKIKSKSNHYYKTGRAHEVAHLWSNVENFNNLNTERKSWWLLLKYFEDTKVLDAMATDFKIPLADKVAMMAFWLQGNWVPQSTIAEKCELLL